MNRMLAGASLAVLLLASPAMAQVERREMGNQILENVPVAAPSIRAGLNRYQNVRAASFSDWASDGGMLIVTRFANTNQLHKVAAPGADRSQLTFHDEPVAGVHTLPGGSILFSKDTGGDEWFQLFVRDASGNETQLTETGTRNGSPAWSKDGSVLVWARSTKGSGDADILMRDAVRAGRRQGHPQGRGRDLARGRVARRQDRAAGPLLFDRRVQALAAGRRHRQADPARRRARPRSPMPAASSRRTARACCCCRTRGPTSCA
jgi:hypothetical protein